MTERRPRLVLIIAVFLLVAVWFAFSVRNDDSAVRVAARYISRRTGLFADHNVSQVLRTMHSYARRAEYDDAIAIGVDWTNKHSNDGSNDQVFLAVASMFLEQAKQDQKRVDENVVQAIHYRDKALTIAADSRLGWYSMGTLHDMALISESAGDLSRTQRCVQYRNALKLLHRVLDQLSEKREEISRRTPNTEDQFGVNRDTVEHLVEQTNVTITRVQEKEQKAACQ